MTPAGTSAADAGYVVVDPLKLADSTKPQVYSGDIEIHNKSNAPVYLNVDVYAIPAATVNMKQTAAEVNPTNSNAYTAKNAQLNVVVATEVTVKSGDKNVVLDAVTYSDSATVVPMGVSQGGAAKIQFALEKSTYTTVPAFDTGAPDGKGVAVFKVQGSVNTFADPKFATDDVKVKVVYDAKAMATDEYGDLTPASKNINGTPVAGIAQVGPSFTPVSVSKAANADVVINVDASNLGHGSGKVVATDIPLEICMINDGINAPYEWTVTSAAGKATLSKDVIALYEPGTILYVQLYYGSGGEITAVPAKVTIT